jgi:hypothetical protein
MDKMSRVNRLKYTISIAAALSFAVLPMTAGATQTPSPTLDMVLAAPPATDFNELTTSPLHGKFTAHDWASLNNNSSAATQTEATLNRNGFVDGFGKTWAQASSGHALIEAVMAFSGGRGAADTLTAMESGDKADSSYQKADTASGIGTYYGAHFVDASTQVVEDFFGFVKGNDVFGIAFVSSKDDVLNDALKQAQSQYSSAPGSTIPSSQWPENTTSSSSFPVAALAIGAGVVVVVIVVTLVAFLALRRRTPGMVGAYAMAGAPGVVASGGVAPPVVVQMSPDGHYWWDGQTWRDAAQEAPPEAQRSSDGSYWWDGTNWRPVPQSPPS